jgi:hypothetical protein
VCPLDAVVLMPPRGVLGSSLPVQQHGEQRGKDDQGKDADGDREIDVEEVLVLGSGVGERSDISAETTVAAADEDDSKRTPKVKRTLPRRRGSQSMAGAPVSRSPGGVELAAWLYLSRHFPSFVNSGGTLSDSADPRDHGARRS